MEPILSPLIESSPPPILVAHDLLAELKFVEAARTNSASESLEIMGSQTYF